MSKQFLHTCNLINQHNKISTYRLLLCISLLIFGGIQTSVAGGLLVVLANQANGTTFSNVEVHAMERLSNSTEQWRASGISDTNGRINFDLPGLGTGSTYVLIAVSPFDNQWKTSATLNQTGQYTFPLAHPGLNVTVLNGITNLPLVNQEVHLMQQQNDGNLQWTAVGTTNANGLFNLNVPMPSGNKYVLLTEPYNAGWVTSQIISQPGNFIFKVGTFEVTVVKGSDGSILPNTEIYAMERLPDGSVTARVVSTSDSQGRIQFDLPGLGAGKTYFLLGKSPIDGSWKSSADLSQLGKFTFNLTNTPLKVTVRNAISNEPVANLQTQVMQQHPDGSLTWVTNSITDASGQMQFDITGLGTGLSFVLLAEPYNGGIVTSPVITSPGDFIFSVGSVPVILWNSDTGQAIQNRDISVLKKGSNGNLIALTTAKTDAYGMVQFDIPDLLNGGTITFYTKDSNTQQPFYSPWINQVGPYNFIISSSGNHQLDQTPPSLSITNPLPGTSVSDSGFLIQGVATDDQKMSRVEVIIKDPVKGNHTISANLNNENWAATAPASSVTTGSTVIILTKAFDLMGNVTEKSISVNTSADNIKPVINLLSHQANDKVTDAGFLLSGTATDNIEIKEFTVTIVDPILGQLKNQYAIEVAKNSGNWAVAVKQASPNQVINVTLTAKDFSGNTTTFNLPLNVIHASAGINHLINRITFGATTSLQQEAQSLGLEGFITQQLNPNSINDSELDAKLANLDPPVTPVEWLMHLQNSQLLRATYSKRQLLEKMTSFWENHFNTNALKSWTPDFEIAENNLFRQNALGKFRDILQVSATSPAMNVYLDNVLNFKAEPNENWARELMELHTLGIDGGYTANDVAEVARVFTGWTISNSALSFEPELHDNGEKVVLGSIIPANSGFNGGLQVLDILAKHPSTAYFICNKLLTFFKSEITTAVPLQNCVQDFTNSDGDMKIVVGNIIRSTHFRSAENFRSKVKTPLEMVVGLLRSLKPEMNNQHILWSLQQMGMPLMWNPIPTGYSEIGNDWINSAHMLQRIIFTSGLTNSIPIEMQSYLINPTNIFLNLGYETAEGIVGFLFKLAMANDYTQLEWDQAINILTDDGAIQFDIHASDAEQRIRNLLTVVLNYPSYQLQ